MATVLATLGTGLASTMAGLGTALGSTSTLGTIGTLLSAGGTVYSGLNAASNGAETAAQMKAKGDAEFAASQRKATEQRRQTELVVSRQRAVSAAGGGSTTDPTVVAAMGRTQEQGDYNAMMDMYNGSVSRVDLYKDAEARRSEGASSFIGSLFSAGSTIYSNAARQRALNNGYYNMPPYA